MIQRPKARWENLGDNTYRLELPHGYLYRRDSYSGETKAMCFVPMPSQLEIFSHTTP